MMNILFFASLREKLNTDHEHWTDMQGIQTPKDLFLSSKKEANPG